MNGLIKLMNSNYIYPVNIGNPYEMTVKELAGVIIELTQSTSQLIYLPLPSDDPTNRKPDIQKAQSILNWNPEYNLVDGITKTIEYFKNSNN